MKRIFTLLICIVLALSCLGSTVFAAGEDDGRLSVTTKNGKKYFGIEASEWCIKYVSADGNNDVFLRFDDVDPSGDGKTDVCDLVAVCKNKIDLDLSEKFDAADQKLMRRLLFGQNDFK